MVTPIPTDPARPRSSSPTAAILRMLRRHWLGLWALGPGRGARDGGAARLDPLWRSAAQILVEPPPRTPLEETDVAVPPDTAFVESQIVLLRARPT